VVAFAVSPIGGGARVEDQQFLVTGCARLEDQRLDDARAVAIKPPLPSTKRLALAVLLEAVAQRQTGIHSLTA